MEVNESEFDMSGTIARFIAAALQHPNPPCNGKNPRVSTIKVNQHKNKFNLVTVYCSLAAPEYVDAAWSESNSTDEPSDDFVQGCMVRDAIVFRQTYRRMLFLLPDHRSMIVMNAYYPYLLKETVQKAHEYVDGYVARLIAPGVHHEGNKLVLQSFLREWRVDNADALKSLLVQVYKRG